MVAATATTPDLGPELAPSSSSSSPPDTLKLAPIRESNSQPQHPPQRRGSFGFLRRGRSGEALRGNLNRSRSRLSKSRHREPSIVSSPRAPQLPTLAPQPNFRTIAANSDIFEFTKPRFSKAGHFNMSTPPNKMSSPPARPAPVSPGPPSSPPTSGVADGYDPYAGTPSITNRGRESYATSTLSTINSPRRMRRRRDPTPFNVLILGAKNSGKTSFVNFLASSVSPGGRPHNTSFANSGSLYPAFQSRFLETEIGGERIGLTLWDSDGFENNVVDLQLRNLAAFLDSKFEETFTEEMKVIRSPGITDPHIHCAILLLDPARLDVNIAEAKKGAAVDGYYDAETPHPGKVVGCLDGSLDLQILRCLQGKTTIIPVISKADTVTTTRMGALKSAVWESLKLAGIPLEALGLDNYDPEIESLDNEEYALSDEDDYSVGNTSHAGLDHSTSDGNFSLPHSSSGLSRKTNLDHTHSADTDADPAADNDADTLNLDSPGLPDHDHHLPVQQHDHPALVSRTMDTASVAAPVTTPFLPMSVISPDSYEPGAVGRKFPWGFADPYNLEHCDFQRLHDSLFHEWRVELKEASREQWYENWRTSRLSASRAL